VSVDVDTIKHESSARHRHVKHAEPSYFGRIDGVTYRIGALSERGFILEGADRSLPIGSKVILQSLVCSLSTIRSVKCQFDFSRGVNSCVIPLGLNCKVVEELRVNKYAIEFQRMFEMQKWKLQRAINCHFYTLSSGREKEGEIVKEEQRDAWISLITLILDKLGK